MLNGAAPNESTMSIRNDSKSRSSLTSSRGRVTWTLVEGVTRRLVRRVSEGERMKSAIAGMCEREREGNNIFG